MKARISFLVTSLLVTQFLYSQSGWFWQNPLPQGNGCGSFNMFNSNTGICGNIYNLLRTTDSGENWELFYTGFGNLNSSICWINPSTGYILVDSTTLIKTTNLGLNWFFVSHISSSANLGLTFVNENTGLLINNTSTLWSNGTEMRRTTNGGYIWNIVISDTSYKMGPIDFPSSLTGYAAGMRYIDHVYIKFLKSTNGGLQWDSISNSIVDLSPHCLKFINSNTGFLGGQYFSVFPPGKIFKTTNGGINWVLQSFSFGNAVSSIIFIDSSTGFIVNGEYNYYKTTDAGLNWTEYSFYPIAYRGVYGFYFYDLNTGFAGGGGGLIIKTTNGGINWMKKEPYGEFTIVLNDVKFSDANTGFTGGENGKLFKTTNGGINWNLIQFDRHDEIVSIKNIDNYTWYIASFYYGKVFKTTNTGLSWDTLHLNKYGITKIDFINALTGFGVCKYRYFFKTTNGGLNWDIDSNINHYPGEQNWALDFIDANTGYRGANGVFKTTNGGATWDSVGFGSLFYYPVDIQFINYNSGFIAGNGADCDGTIMKTTNGGQTWISQCVSNYEFADIYFIDDTFGYAMTYGQIFRTINGGVNWYPINSSSYNQKSAIYFSNHSTGYWVGGNCSILKTTTGGEPIGIQPISEEIPNHFVLHQNYPNPFNPSTTIKFSIPSSKGAKGVVKLTIYDILGREVAVLVNEKLSPGTYEVEWSATGGASNFASGIYFYKLSINNKRFATKKMVLLK